MPRYAKICQDMPRYAKICQDMPRFHWVCTSSGSQCSLAGFRCVGRKNARYGWRKLELCARCASVAPTRAVDNTTGPWKCSLYPGEKISAKMQDETLRSNSWNWELKIKLIEHVIPFFRKTEALGWRPKWVWQWKRSVDGNASKVLQANSAPSTPEECLVQWTIGPPKSCASQSKIEKWWSGAFWGR